MAAVKEFILSLMIVSASAAAISMLAPDNSGSSKYVQFLCSIAVTALLLSPMRDIIGLLPEMLEGEVEIDSSIGTEAESVYAEYVIEETCRRLEEEISNEIENRLNREVNSVSIECDATDIENVIIEKVTVEYVSANAFVCSDTVNYVEELLDCECEVVVLQDE